MMRMDSELRDAERQAIASTLQTQFNLDTTQFETLIALAEREARNATDYYQFTSLINKHCDLGQKVQIIENLWHVAMIDGHLDAHELHLMRKLADLLYVGHATMSRPSSGRATRQNCRSDQIYRARRVRRHRNHE
jgi:uncharacterized tellurite resistance protein B-like protein